MDCKRVRMSSKIAIVIPAYKTDFLRNTLESIAVQDSRDFTVYIGDDASPADIYGIVRDFESRMDIVYRRFEKNMGRTDLVGHWKRCIDMSYEPWVFFFSDDDKMPSDAVSRILRTVEEYPQDRFFRFRLGLIDGSDCIVRTNPDFRSQYNMAEDILVEYLSGKISSAACEYVFHRSLVGDGTFVGFPLAWCSDVATWYKMSSMAGRTVNMTGDPVLWRNAANVNISSSSGLEDRKAEALALFIRWLERNYKGRKDRKLRRALEVFIKTNLRISFNGNYTEESLKNILSAYCSFSGFRALMLYIKFHRS